MVHYVCFWSHVTLRAAGRASMRAHMVTCTVQAILNLYVDKSFVQLIKHCHSTKLSCREQRKAKYLVQTGAINRPIFLFCLLSRMAMLY